MKTTRRGFLGAAVGALGAGLVAGCSERLPRYLIPHAIPPDDAVPGIARYYRTICRECPAGCGVTARVREGRVVKLEGSPEHPMSRGALVPARAGRRSRGSTRPIGWARRASPAARSRGNRRSARSPTGLRRALDAKQAGRRAHPPRAG